MHVLMLAARRSDALALADAWSRAAPHTTAEALAVDVPGPAAPSTPGGAAPDAVGHGPTTSGGRAVLVAGTALPVGPPAAGTARGGPTPVRATSALDPDRAAALAARAASADLVVVLVPVLDGDSLHRGPVVEAAVAAAPVAVPVVVVAGRSEAGRREWSAAGLSGVHEVGDEPAARIGRVARTWAPAWTGPGTGPGSGPGATAGRDGRA